MGEAGVFGVPVGTTDESAMASARCHQEKENQCTTPITPPKRAPHDEAFVRLPIHATKSTAGLGPA